MKAKDIKAWRSDLNMNAQQFADFVGANWGRTVHRWESGFTPVPGYVKVLYDVLAWVPEPVRRQLIVWLRNRKRK